MNRAKKGKTMSIFPNDSEAYTGPETISSEYQAHLEIILELNLSPDEKLILSCRQHGDTWPDIAVRLRVSKDTVQRTYKRACFKVCQIVKAIKKA